MAVFTNDSVPVVLAPSQLANKEITFSGRISNPLYAELQSPQLPTPMGFFIESSTIRVVLNTANPAKSQISGSQVNSLYRYQLEQASQDTALLRQYLEQSRGEIFDALLISDLLPCLQVPQVLSYVNLLKGNATKGYLYSRLKKQVSSMVQTMEGMRMPDFQYADDKGKIVRYDAVRSDSLVSVILIGATWCDQCNRIESQLKLLQKQFSPLKIHTIHIDKHKQGWNAQYLQQLSVDHIPYLIVIDNHGIIRVRDERIWQLERTLNEIKNTK